MEAVGSFKTLGKFLPHGTLSHSGRHYSSLVKIRIILFIQWHLRRLINQVIMTKLIWELNLSSPGLAFNLFSFYICLLHSFHTVLQVILFRSNFIVVCCFQGPTRTAMWNDNCCRPYSTERTHLWVVEGHDPRKFWSTDCHCNISFVQNLWVLCWGSREHLFGEKKNCVCVCFVKQQSFILYIYFHKDQCFVLAI